MNFRKNGILPRSRKFLSKREFIAILKKRKLGKGSLPLLTKVSSPTSKSLRRAVTQEDIVRLLEIKIKRISKYDSFRADEQIKGYEDEISEVEGNLAQLTRYAIRYFKELKKKYGKGRERKTEISRMRMVS